MQLGNDDPIFHSQDRALSAKPPAAGASELLALAGDFNTIDTLSVSRLGLPRGTAGLPARALAEALTADKRQSGSTLRFNLEGVREVEAEAGASAAAVTVRYVAFDYAVETCRGTVTEESGGRLSCVTAQDGGLLQTVLRRATCVAAVGGDEASTPALLLVASTPAARWAEAEPTLRAIAASFKALGLTSTTSRT